MSEQREQFRRRIEELVAQFEGEVDRREWVTRRYPKKLRDDSGEVYEAPALYLQKGPTRLLLDPIGYDVPGAEGAADLYLMPTYDPMASIYFEDGRWAIHYVFPSDPMETHSVVEAEVLPLSVDTINRVLDSIAESLGRPKEGGQSWLARTGSRLWRRQLRGVRCESRPRLPGGRPGGAGEEGDSHAGRAAHQNVTRNER